MIYLRVVLAVAIFFTAGCAKSDKSEIKGLPKEAVDSRAAELSGKIVFISNRDGGRGEVWLFEKGAIKKVLSKSDSENPMPQGVPSFLGGAFGGYEQPRLTSGGNEVLVRSGRKFGVVDLRQPEKANYYLDGSRAILTRGGAYVVRFDASEPAGGSDNIYYLQDNNLTKISNLTPMPGSRQITQLNFNDARGLLSYAMMGEKEYGVFSVWTIKSNGTDNRLIARAAHGGAFSPDGKKLAYASPLNQQGERIHEQSKIFIYDFESGDARQVTFGPWSDQDAVFSPDGKWICYVSYRHIYPYAGAELYALNLETGEEVQITPAKKLPSHAKDPGRGWATDETPHWSE